MNQEVDVINEVSIVDLLDHALVEDNKKMYGGVRDRSPLRPSSAGKCARQLAYQFHEFKDQKEATQEDKAPNVIRLLSVGHYIERSMIRHLRQMKDHFGIEVKYTDQIVSCCKLKDGTIIQGEVDFAIEGNGFKILGDAKSTKDKFSSFHRTQWDEITQKWERMKCIKKISDTCFYAKDAAALVKALKDDFKVDNILQLNFYLGSPFFQERGYDTGALYYYVKNDSRMFELRFKFSKKLHNMIRDKYQNIYDSKAPEDVEKTFTLGSIRCAFCEFNYKCWSDSDPKYEYFQTLPKKKWARDLAKLDNAKQIEKLFDKYEKALTNMEEKDNIEKEITDKLFNLSVEKVKRKNGDIWEVRKLKTPREHLVLRRSKN